MKRVLCAVLVLALMASSLPMAVFADNSNTEPTVPSGTIVPAETAETTVPAEAAETTVPAETAETTVPAETAETTVPAETAETTVPAETADEATTETMIPTEAIPLNDKMEGETQTVSAAGAQATGAEKPVMTEGRLRYEAWAGDSEKLLDGYLSNIMYSNGMVSLMGTAGRDHLSAKDQIIYDSLAAMVQEVAMGIRHLAKQGDIIVTYSAKDLGLDYLWSGGRLTDEANEQISKQMAKVMFAVLEDHPYECYWIDKQHYLLYMYSYIPSTSSGGMDQVQISCMYSFPVAAPYAKRDGRVDQYGAYIETDPQKTGYAGAAHKAAERAQKLVLEKDGLGDLEKLQSYKEFICNEVTYDHDAVVTGPNDENGGSAWQMISVFDGDPSTNVVCEGYSKAFQYLCDLSSFQNEIVCYQDIGIMRSGSSGGLHMWNIVEINGTKLLADITNSDFGSIGQNGELFLVTAKRVPNGFTIMNIFYEDQSPEDPIKYLPDETIQPQKPRFPDVPTTLYCYEAVNWAVGNGITRGKPDGTFGTTDKCIRRHAVMFFWRAAGCPEPASMENPFVDVKHDSFEKAILWAYYAGITAGTDDTHFNPNGICTRKQIVTFLWRANGRPEPLGAISFPDVKHDSFEKAILWAAEQGITGGYKDGTFHPDNTCTRGQIVTFLYRNGVG